MGESCKGHDRCYLPCAFAQVGSGDKQSAVSYDGVDGQRHSPEGHHRVDEADGIVQRQVCRRDVRLAEQPAGEDALAHCAA